MLRGAQRGGASTTPNGRNNKHNKFITARRTTAQRVHKPTSLVTFCIKGVLALRQDKGTGENARNKAPRSAQAMSRWQGHLSGLYMYNPKMLTSRRYNQHKLEKDDKHAPMETNKQHYR